MRNKTLVFFVKRNWKLPKNRRLPSFEADDISFDKGRTNWITRTKPNRVTKRNRPTHAWVIDPTRSSRAWPRSALCCRTYTHSCQLFCSNGNISSICVKWIIFAFRNNFRRPKIILQNNILRKYVLIQICTPKTH